MGKELNEMLMMQSKIKLCKWKEKRAKERLSTASKFFSTKYCAMSPPNKKYSKERLQGLL